MIRNDFIIEIGQTTYKIYERIIRPDFTAKRISETLKLSKSTVKYHIDKLLKLQLIKCINPNDRIKFYEKTVEPNITPGKRKGTYLLSSNDSGRESKYGSLRPKDSRGHVAVINGYERHKLIRIHAAVYKVPILEKWKDYYKEIEWDKVSRPHGKFEQYTKKDKVKEVGDVSFKWIHTTNKDTLFVYLPMYYFLPHEVQAGKADQILVDLAWKGFKHFIKKYHVGVERLMEQVGTYHRAEIASEKHRKYLKKFGTLEIETPNGKIMLDDSMGDGGEIEADNDEDILLYNEVRGDLMKPAVIVEMKDNINTLSGQLSEVKKKTKEHENFLKDFTYTFTQYLDQDKKKWETQQEFNETVKEYMERTDGKIERIMLEVGLGRRPTTQTKLNIYDNKNGEIGYV